MFLGIEIGGTKLQLGIGADDGVLRAVCRRAVDVGAGPEGIRRQIREAMPELLRQSGLARAVLAGAGIGFGGPVDDAARTIIKSHQIEGWDLFPLADWVAEVTGLPAVLGNDADVAGLAEALHGSGKGLSPIFYITVGSGIGGGFILDGKIYRGVGRGAAEVGHLRTVAGGPVLEDIASGWGISARAQASLRTGHGRESRVLEMAQGRLERVSAEQVALAAAAGDVWAGQILQEAVRQLAASICQVIALLCPRRVVLGGGVSLMGEKLFIEPIRQFVAEHVFRPFAGLTEIVPAALGEEVVVHGAIALARQTFGPTSAKRSEPDASATVAAEPVANASGSEASGRFTVDGG